MLKRNGRPHRRLDERVHSVDAGRRVATSRSPVAAGSASEHAVDGTARPGAPDGPAVRAAVALVGLDGDVVFGGLDRPPLLLAAGGVVEASDAGRLRGVPGEDEGVLDHGTGPAVAPALRVDAAGAHVGLRPRADVPRAFDLAEVAGVRNREDQVAAALGAADLAEAVEDHERERQDAEEQRTREPTKP